MFLPLAEDMFLFLLSRIYLLPYLHGSGWGSGANWCICPPLSVIWLWREWSALALLKGVGFLHMYTWNVMILENVLHLSFFFFISEMSWSRRMLCICHSSFFIFLMYGKWAIVADEWLSPCSRGLNYYARNLFLSLSRIYSVCVIGVVWGVRESGGYWCVSSVPCYLIVTWEIFIYLFYFLKMSLSLARLSCVIIQENVLYLSVIFLTLIIDW